MLSLKQEANLHKLLIEAQAVILSEIESAYDYHSLKTQVLKEELDIQIKLMLAHLEDGTGNFHEAFKELCKERASLNIETCLSFFAMPNGHCNELYWQIAMCLFEPKTLSEILAILLPHITTLVMPELDLDLVKGNEAEYWQLKAVAKSPIFRFKKVSVSELHNPPAIEELSHFVAAGPFILDVSSLETLSFNLHERFEKALQTFNPQLAQKLYQHNKELKTLAGHLQRVSNQGEIPYSVIKRFIQELRLGGEKITGKFLATTEAEHAHLEFVSYVETLPSLSRQAFLKLKTKDGLKNFEAILAHLSAGNCVEQAAGYLEGILDNKANQTVLHTRPNISVEQIQAIKKQYSHHAKVISLPIRGFDPTTTLVPLYLEENLERIVIDSAYSYISFLLSFPPSLYDSLLRHAQITCEPSLPSGLIKNIARGLFNREQLQALYQAILSNSIKLGGFKVLLPFAIQIGNPEFLEFIKARVSANQFLELIKKRDEKGRSVFHFAASKPECLKFLLNLFSEEEALIQIKVPNKSNYKALHYAGATPKCLELLLSLYPESERFKAITEVIDNNNSFIHSNLIRWLIAHSEIESLHTVLDLLPLSQLVVALRAPVTETRETLLHWLVINYLEYSLTFLQKLALHEHKQLLEIKDRASAFIHRLAEENPNIFRLMIQQTSTERLMEIVNIPNNGGISVLRWAGENDPESFKVIWELLSNTERLSVLKKVSPQGFNLLHFVIGQEESLRVILQTLSENDRSIVLKRKNVEGNNSLYCATAFPKSLALILSFYPGKTLLQDLTTTNKKGLSAIELVLVLKENTELLNLILRRIPYEERLAFLKKDGAIILQLAAKSKECMHAIVTSLSDNPKLWDAYQYLTKQSLSNQIFLRRLKCFARGGETQIIKGQEFFPFLETQKLHTIFRPLIVLTSEERSLIAQLFLDSKKIDYSEIRPSSSARALNF